MLEYKILEDYMTHDEATLLSFFSDFGGHRDWRLPTHDELHWLCYYYSNRENFNCDIFWISTPCQVFDFSIGAVHVVYPNVWYQTIIVRGSVDTE